MKTIGTCKECKWWEDRNKTQPDLYCHGNWGFCGISKNNLSMAGSTMSDFGCVHWEDKREPREDYPLRTKQDLEIADLKRENNAAFERIQELSQALVNLGFDPTKKANKD